MGEIKVIGIICLAVGLWFFWNRIGIINYFDETQGVVIKLSETSGSYKGYPTVKIVVDAVEYVFSSSYAGNYSIGDKVQVLFNPSKPDDAYINSNFDFWGLPVALILVFFV